jgi:hypothetical protein
MRPLIRRWDRLKLDLLDVSDPVVVLDDLDRWSSRERLDAGMMHSQHRFL